MTATERNTPWKNGYWYNKNEKCMLTIINGEKVELRNLIALDFPDSDMEPLSRGTITFGDFGPAIDDIATATGMAF